MGIKSTKHLTRAEAESLFVELMQSQMTRALKAQGVALTNTQLENALERLNDQRCHE